MSSMLSSFAAIPLESIPLEVAYVVALSQQEAPDYFAGPAMAKTITQETKVVFGLEQEEWKAVILAELESFAKLGVYEAFRAALCWWRNPTRKGERERRRHVFVVWGQFPDSAPR